MKHRNTATHQAGLSLIELLISLTIGLVILTAIGTAYLNTTNTTRQREDQAQLNEPARNVMRILRQNLMQAGYVDIFDQNQNDFLATLLFKVDPGSAGLRRANMYIRDPATEAAVGPIDTPLTLMFPGITPLFGCDGAMNNTTPNGIATAGAVQGCGAASATRHTLQVAYQGVPLIAANAGNSLAAANANTGEGLDCLQQLPPAANIATVINRFSVSNAAELQCEGSGAAGAQPLAEGVEEFVLRYQMSAPGLKANELAAGGSQQRYMSATEVAASNQGWAGVTAVEICMVSATSNAQGAAARGTAELQPTRPTCTRNADGAFDENIARADGDRRLWKRYTSVVSVRNAVFASPL